MKSVRRPESVMHAGVLSAILVTIVLAHAAICLALNWRLPFWQDEMATLATTTGALRRVMERAVHFEKQGVLYFVLLRVWRTMDGSPVAARMFSTVCSAVSVMLASRMVRGNAARSSVVALTAVVAINPFLVWAGTEARAYALAILVSMFMLWFYQRCVSGDNRRVRYWIAFGIVSGIGVHVHYYLGLLFASMTMYPLIRTARRNWRNVLLTMGIVGVCVLPLLIVLPSQVPSYLPAGGGPTGSVNLLDGLDKTVRRIEEHLIAMDSVTPVVRMTSRVLVGSVLTVSLLCRATVPGGGKDAFLSAIGMTAFAASVVSVVVFVGLHPDLMDGRHVFYFWAPVLMTALILPGKGIPGNWHAIAVAALVSTLCFGYLVDLESKYRQAVKGGDAYRVAKFLEQEATERTKVVVFPQFLSLPLKYYYSRPQMVFALPSHEDLAVQEWRVENRVVRSTEHLQEELESVLAPTESFWLYTDDMREYVGVDIGRGILEKYLEQHYRVRQQRGFHGAYLILWEPRLSR